MRRFVKSASGKGGCKNNAKSGNFKSPTLLFEVDADDDEQRSACNADVRWRATCTFATMRMGFEKRTLWQRQRSGCHVRAAKWQTRQHAKGPAECNMHFSQG
eukprot:TRINITY_DN45997_c0_g1_i1.p4 TRINITY_DN45997_c0_g1~~TRINITY_DN45997_c0_g1_i1.p4  ORF type:complete len:102 (+),score=16.92 TRINITY_DN45997_c0_g1_i1:169-474(+)